MTAIVNYEIEIVHRTLEILKSFYPTFDEQDKEVTFLMNCLLGIIIAIAEKEKRSRKMLNGAIDENFVKLLPNRIGFIKNQAIDIDITDQDFTDLKLKIGHKPDLIGKDKLWFISKIRNCIAHQNIYGINENDIWVGVRIWNINNSKKDFEAIFTMEELKKYSIYLAEEFVRIHSTDSTIED